MTDTDPDLSDVELESLESIWGAAEFDFDPARHPKDERGRWASAASASAPSGVPTGPHPDPGDDPQVRQRVEEWSAALKKGIDPGRKVRSGVLDAFDSLNESQLRRLAEGLGLPHGGELRDVKNGIDTAVYAGLNHPGEGVEHSRLWYDIDGTLNGNSSLPMRDQQLAHELKAKKDEEVEYLAKLYGVHSPGNARADNVESLVGMIRRVGSDHGKSDAADAELATLRGLQEPGKRLSGDAARGEVRKRLEGLKFSERRYLERKLGLEPPGQNDEGAWKISQTLDRIVRAVSVPITDRIAADAKSHEVVAAMADVTAKREAARATHGDRLQQVADALGKHYETRCKLATPEERAQFDATHKAEQDTLAAEADRLSAACAADVSQDRAKLVELIKPTDPAVWKFKNESGTKKHRETLEAAIRFFSQTLAHVGDGPRTPLVDVALRKTKTRARAQKVWTQDGEPRKGIVWLDETNIATAVHELGHQIEYHSPGVLTAAKDFLAHRVKDEAAVSFRAKFPSHNYDSDEFGAEDDFGKFFGKGDHRAYYCGKDYGGSSTEIVSMGTEYLFRNPAEFCAKDAEFATFIIGILRGTIR